MSYKSIFNKESFSKKNIVVTGGGSGIGRCIAHELSSLGSDIILVGIMLFITSLFLFLSDKNYNNK